jgi:four helix bundle protein
MKVPGPGSRDANVLTIACYLRGMDEPEGLDEWAEREVPEVMRNDPIWRLPAYRYSLYLGDLIQTDIYRMRGDIRTRSCVDQLISAIASISSNIAEGYSRTTGPDRAKYYEYGHSSAREGRDWLFKTRHPIDRATTFKRIELVSRVMRILVVAIKRERADPESRARRWIPSDEVGDAR